MEGTTFAADPMRLMIATAGKSAAKESVERFRKYIGEYRRGVHERESDSSCLSSGKRKPYAF
mgnify:CR=1 FL=1